MTSPPGRHEFAVVGSELLHQGRILALRVDQVRMPRGRVARREVVEHHGGVGVLALDAEDRVVLIHQYRHAVRRRLWEVPAGLLDVPGEDPAAAAARELAEEVGLAAEHWSALVDVAVSPGFTDESVRVFLATGLSAAGSDAGPRPADADDEESDLVVTRVPLTVAVQRALSGEIVNACAVAGLLALAAVRAGAGAPRPADAPWTDLPRAFAER